MRILPAYTIDGVIYCGVYEKNTDVNGFEGFIKSVLPFCGRFPQPRSVIFMDNASFHLSKRIEQMIANAGVILEYSSPYSPDLMPIQYYYGALKNIIRSKAQDDEDLIRGDFKSYIEMQIGSMQEDKESPRRMARGRFRLAGIYIEEE